MQQNEPAAKTLYMVGTPIGHLDDLSPRARKLLSKVDIIACEDTRRSGQLLNKIGSKVTRISFHRHNIRSRLPQLLELLGKRLRAHF